MRFPDFLSRIQHLSLYRRTQPSIYGYEKPYILRLSPVQMLLINRVIRPRQLRVLSMPYSHAQVSVIVSLVTEVMRNKEESKTKPNYNTDHHLKQQLVIVPTKRRPPTNQHNSQYPTAHIYTICSMT